MSEDYLDMLRKEKERLAKLWDAYEIQERELESLKKEKEIFEHDIETGKSLIESLRETVSKRDEEIAELEIEVRRLKKEKDIYTPKMEKLEQTTSDYRNKIRRLIKITEDIEKELIRTRKQVRIRDEWFENYMGNLRNFSRAVDEREVMLRSVTYEDIDAASRISEVMKDDKIDRVLEKKAYVKKEQPKFIPVEKTEKIEKKTLPAPKIPEEYISHEKFIVSLLSFDITGLGVNKIIKLIDNGYTSLEDVVNADVDGISSKNIKGISDSLIKLLVKSAAKEIKVIEKNALKESVATEAVE